MDKKEILQIVEKSLDKETRKLVGVLCKRLEVLDEQGVLSTKLYKSLTKEHIYEFSRNLKQILRLQIEIGKVEFHIPRNK